MDKTIDNKGAYNDECNNSFFHCMVIPVFCSATAISCHAIQKSLV